MEINNNLWGVTLAGPSALSSWAMVNIRLCCQCLASVTGQQLILTANPQLFMDWPFNISTPRSPQSGSLEQWLNIWQDTPAPGIIWLNGMETAPAMTIIEQLAQAHGSQKILSAHPRRPSPAYYSRASMGAGLRLLRQGHQDLEVLLKVLRAPSLPL
jgi:hypothetical protein